MFDSVLLQIKTVKYTILVKKFKKKKNDKHYIKHTRCTPLRLTMIVVKVIGIFSGLTKEISSSESFLLLEKKHSSFLIIAVNVYFENDMIFKEQKNIDQEVTFQKWDINKANLRWNFIRISALHPSPPPPTLRPTTIDGRNVGVASLYIKN